MRRRPDPRKLRQIIFSTRERLGSSKDSRRFSNPVAARAVVGVVPHCVTLTREELVERHKLMVNDAVYSLPIFPD